HLEQYDQSVQEIFFKNINKLIGQSFVKKPSKTLAKEVVQKMLSSLVYNKPNPTLFEVYRTWLDSNYYRESFEGYLRSYKLPLDFELFKVQPSHPFREIDERWLKELGK